MSSLTTSSAVDSASPAAQSPSPAERYSMHPLLFAGICLGSIFFLYHIVGSAIALIAVGSKITRENATTMRWFTTAGQLLFILAPTLVFARLMSRRLADVFWWRTPSWREVGFMVIALVSLQQLLEVYVFLQDLLPLPEPIQKALGTMRDMYRTMLKNVVKAENVPELFFVITIAALIPSIVEEMLFRGVVQRTMERMFQPLIAVLVTGMIFGAFHLDIFNLIPLMVIGIFMSYLRWRSKSIVLPMAAHFLNNLAAVIAVFAGMDMETKITTAELGVSDALAAITQTLFFGLLLWLSLRSYNRSTEQLQTLR